MAKLKNPELSRVSINIPNSTIEKVKKYAESNGINITSAYIVLLNQALEQRDMINNLPLMINMACELKQQAENIKLQLNNTEK